MLQHAINVSDPLRRPGQPRPGPGLAGSSERIRDVDCVLEHSEMLMRAGASWCSDAHHVHRPHANRSPRRGKGL